MLYQSLDAETFVPAACSGDMYAAVPSSVHLGGQGEPLAAQFGRQAEVEEYDPAPRRHQHVRRLDVAMQLARAVQRRDPLSELQERVPEASSPGRREWRGGLSRPTIGSATGASEARPSSASVVIKPVRRQFIAGVPGSSRTYRRKSTPSTSSMTMYQPRPLKMSSYSRTRLMWTTSRRLRNSCLNRRIALGLSCRTVFNATSAPRFLSSAR